MARSIVPNKGIILMDNDGNISEVLLQYKVNTDGVIASNFNTVSVLPALDPAALAALGIAAINSAKQSEGIS